MRTSRALMAVVVTASLAAGAVVAVESREPAAPDRPALPLALPAPGPGALSVVDEGAVAVPTAAGVRRRLATRLAAPELGTAPAATVVDVTTGEVLLDVDGSRPVVPASTAKIATAVAVLSTLDPDERLATQVRRGAAPGQLVLVGGGDPTLTVTAVEGSYPERGSLDDLAAQVRAAGVVSVSSLVVDTGLYSGPELGPGWKPSYVTGGNVAPVLALMTDGGRTAPGSDARSLTPDLAAGAQLLARLAARGVVVAPGAAVTRGTAPAGAEPLATTRSDRVEVLVEQMLTSSDNDLAEALGRQVALAARQPASFAGTAAGIAAALVPFTLPAGSVALVDASGLSRDDRLQPRAVAALLALAASDAHPELRPLLSGLPVAGFTGTLTDRYRSAGSLAAAGVVRAKTGTLSGVSALAGVVVTADGRLLAFDLTADGVAPNGTATLDARQALDDLATALAGCGCG